MFTVFVESASSLTSHQSDVQMCRPLHVNGFLLASSRYTSPIRKSALTYQRTVHLRLEKFPNNPHMHNA